MDHVGPDKLATRVMIQDTDASGQGKGFLVTDGTKMHNWRRWVLDAIWENKVPRNINFQADPANFGDRTVFSRTVTYHEQDSWNACEGKKSGCGIVGAAAKKQREKKNDRYVREDEEGCHGKHRERIRANKIEPVG